MSETVDTNKTGRSYEVHNIILDGNGSRNLLVESTDNELAIFT